MASLKRIKPDDLVLEIGSGNNPHPRADILCDRYLTKNIERAGAFSIVVDRPFVVCDGYRLPFADKSFDYVICSHILEHMERPAAFLDEIMRVGKAGYIEVPSALSERLFGWNFHHWYCTARGRTLVMIPKTEGERFGGFFHHLIEHNIWFRRLFEEHESEWYVRFEWTNRIKHVISRQKMSLRLLNTIDRKIWKRMGEARPIFVDDLLFYCRWMMRRLIKKIKKEFRLSLWHVRTLLDTYGIVSQLTGRLICVSCGSSLSVNKESNMLVCTSCKKIYPVRGCIPIMLTVNEKTKGY